MPSTLRNFADTPVMEQSKSICHQKGSIHLDVGSVFVPARASLLFRKLSNGFNKWPEMVHPNGRGWKP